VLGRPFIGSEGERGGWASEGNRQQRWWLSGAITLAVSALHEGKIDDGEGKRQGQCPLRGGEGADGEAARRGGTPALGGGGGLLEEGEGEGAGVG
jgi:hypothetical protein